MSVATKRYFLLIAIVAHCDGMIPPLLLGQAPSHPGILFVHGRGYGGKPYESVRGTFVTEFADAQRRRYGKQIIPDSLIGFAYYMDAVDARSPAPPHEIMLCNFLSVESPGHRQWLETLRAGLINLATSLKLEGEALQYFTTDTYNFLASDKSRCESVARISIASRQSAMRGRPLIIVAHSMGAMVSLAALRMQDPLAPQDRPYTVLAYFTLGAQVGEPLVARGLFGSLLTIPAKVPLAVPRWTNIVNKNDPLAFRTASTFTASAVTRRPKDVVINASGNVHAFATYIGNRAVMNALIDSWCSATWPRAPQCP